MFCTIFNLKALIIVSFYRLRSLHWLPEVHAISSGSLPSHLGCSIIGIIPIYDFLTNGSLQFPGKLLCSSFLMHCVLTSGFKPFIPPSMLKLTGAHRLHSFLFNCSCFPTKLGMHLFSVPPSRKHILYTLLNTGEIG